jgi:hypothetical protein
MAGITYEELGTRLTPDARTLFCEMVDAYLIAGSGDRLFMRSDTMSGTGMIFAGSGARRDWRNFDSGALDDLVNYGLLHPGLSSRGSRNYRISGEGLHFYRWLMDHQGGAITQMEEAIQRALSGDASAEAHPGAAHHLREAFNLLWESSEAEQAISEIGDHLRKALMDTTTDVLGTGSRQQERPVEGLKVWLTSQSRLTARELDVLQHLVDLARVVLRLDHRLNHVRDEADKGEAAPTWEEVRRAAFTTALVCYELDRVKFGR